jgi:hypothetical protein
MYNVKPMPGFDITKVNNIIIKIIVTFYLISFTSYTHKTFGVWYNYASSSNMDDGLPNFNFMDKK